MLPNTAWKYIQTFVLVCAVLPCVIGKTNPPSGSFCRTSSGSQGKCVLLKNCPKLRVIDEKPYVNRQEMDLLIGAAGACSPDSEQYCCADGDIRWNTKPTTKLPTRRKMEENNTRPGQNCLQTQLGMGSIGRPSLDTSFGVFITHTRKNKHSRCVGSLITPEYVLTAAHCVRKAYGIHLYVNAQHITNDTVLGVLKGDVDPSYVREVIIHEEYNVTTRDHDIALLQLNETVAQGDIGSPAPICIPMGTKHDEVSTVDQTLRCFGWGVNAYGDVSNSKQWVTLERISQEQCQARMDSLRVERVLVTKRNICTITITGHDAYAGYSGGPLMYRKDGTWFLIGLISFGVGKTSSKYPVVSVNVQQYTDWILDKIHRKPKKN